MSGDHRGQRRGLQGWSRRSNGVEPRLKSTPDGDGSLLDHTMVLYGSGLSDGNRYSHADLPLVLAGRGDGSLKPGRHIAYDGGTPITNLFLTVLDRTGVRPEGIGDSTGTVQHLSDLS